MRRTLQRLALFTSLPLTPSLIGPASAATISYQPSLGTLPEAQGWIKREGGAPQPAPTVSGGVLHQGPTDFSGHQYWEYGGATFNFSTATVTVDFRLRVTAASFSAYPRGGYTVFLSDSTGRLASLYLSDGSVFLGNDQFTSVSSIVAFDTTDAFHDYRFSIGPSGSSLHIDNTPIVSLALGGVTVSANYVAFGDGTLIGNSESELTAFSVSGVSLLNIPEPASLLLLSCGLVAVSLLRRNE